MQWVFLSLRLAHDILLIKIRHKSGQNNFPYKVLCAEDYEFKRSKDCKGDRRYNSKGQRYQSYKRHLLWVFYLPCRVSLGLSLFWLEQRIKQGVCPRSNSMMTILNALYFAANDVDLTPSTIRWKAPFNLLKHQSSSIVSWFWGPLVQVMKDKRNYSSY